MMQSECREWQHVLNLLHSNMNITTELDAVKASPLAGPYPHPWAMAALCALPWITQRRNNPSQCFTGRWRQTEQDAAAAADVTDSRWDAAAGLYRLTAVGLSCSCSRPVSLSRWDVMVASVTLKPLLLLLLSSAALLSSPPSLRTLIFKGRLKRRDGVFTPESLLCWQRWIIHWCAHHPHIIRTHPSIHPSNSCVAGSLQSCEERNILKSTFSFHLLPAFSDPALGRLHAAWKCMPEATGPGEAF